MKRRAVVLIIICIVGLCLHFSRLICTTDAQILLYIAKEKGIESVDGLTLTDIIISDDKTNALVICELGQPYVSRIFAWKFNVIASNLFIPSRGYTQNDEPWPIKTYIWDSKYIVIINDLSAKSYSVILDGQKKIEKIENYPTILQFPLATTLWGDRIFEKCGIGRDEGGDGGKTPEIRGKRRLSARDGGANYQQS